MNPRESRSIIIINGRDNDHPSKPPQRQIPPSRRNIDTKSQKWIIAVVFLLFWNGIHFLQLVDVTLSDDHFNNEYAPAPSAQQRKPRVLVGIFSIDTYHGYLIRERHRTLFQSWNDTRICCLAVYQSYAAQLVHSPGENNPCEFVYTFVIGANPDGTKLLVQVPAVVATRDKDDEEHDGPTERNTTMDRESISSSWLMPLSSLQNGPDRESPDMTLLNIRENMNYGKSQSWIAYSSTMLANAQSDFDYIAKWDDDSILLLPEYFDFVDTNLPSHKPYNSMFFVGTPLDKSHWDKRKQTVADHERVETLYDLQYNGIHVYFGGQLYIMSIDLAQFITEEAIQNNCTYCEFVEDHDIASIAFHSISRSRISSHLTSSNEDDPHHPTSATELQSHLLIKLLFVGRYQQFWEHPIKTNDKWEVIWQREKQRIPFH